jgi:hypothetical protein
MTATSFAFFVSPLLSQLASPFAKTVALILPDLCTSIRVTYAEPNAVIEIADDGIGGANPAEGSGLRGLADRVEAPAVSCQSPARRATAR